MTAAPILIIIVTVFLWLLHSRFKDNFLRAYGLFFLVLLIYASNKEYYGITAAMSEEVFSPLNLIRWGLLFSFVWYAWRMKMPARYKIDVALGAMVVLLLCDMLISSIYADSFSYSFLRALSFALLSLAFMKGMSFYLYGSVNCLRLFRFKYYVAWIVLAPMILILLSGGGYGVTIIMGQYAGMFGNQNMFGIFSAMITPYVLFHWRVVAQRRWAKWLDLSLLAVIFAGLWFSGSRNGMGSCLLAIASYFFVINLQSRIKVLAAGICLIVALAILPSFRDDLTRFIRKGTDKTAQVAGLSSQIIEEKRYEMWSGVWPMFWERKLTGYGFAASHLLVFPFTRDREAGRSLHNSYLEIFGDLGLPGLILLLLILLRIGTRAFVLIRQQGDLLERDINAVFISGFIAGSANAFFESWMFSVGNLISLMYWGAVTGIVARWAWRPVEATAEQPLVTMHPALQYVAARMKH